MTPPNTNWKIQFHRTGSTCHPHVRNRSVSVGSTFSGTAKVTAQYQCICLARVPFAWSMANGIADVIVVMTRETGEGIPIDLKMAAKDNMVAAVATHRNYRVEYGGVCISEVGYTMPLTLPCNHRHWVVALCVSVV